MYPAGMQPAGFGPMPSKGSIPRQILEYIYCNINIIINI